MDSLALANVQLQLKKALQRFFSDDKTGYPEFKSKHHSKKSYTTNLVNGNIVLTDNTIRLPKLKEIRIIKHREAPEDWKLKSVTVTQEASGKYYVSVLYEYESQVIVHNDTDKTITVVAKYGIVVNALPKYTVTFSDGGSVTQASYGAKVTLPTRSAITPLRKHACITAFDIASPPRSVKSIPIAKPIARYLILLSSGKISSSMNFAAISPFSRHCFSTSTPFSFHIGLRKTSSQHGGIASLEFSTSELFINL